MTTLRRAAIAASVELACHVPGHEDHPGCQSDMGYELPFCQEHFDALPVRLQKPLLALAPASIFERVLHEGANIALKDAAHWLVDRLVVPGICQVCGCTQEYGCDVGCAWANRARTLCTACVPREGRPKRAKKTPKRKAKP